VPDIYLPVLESLEKFGGYAILAGFSLIILVSIIFAIFNLARRWVDGMAARTAARESELKANFAAQLEREHMSKEGYREMAQISTETLNRVAAVMGETNATLRQTNHAFERNTDAFNSAASVFTEFIQLYRRARERGENME